MVSAFGKRYINRRARYPVGRATRAVDDRTAGVRAAQLMIKRHGEKALDESAARADELALAGDDDGATTWRRIMATVTPTRQQNPARPGQLMVKI